MSPSSPETKSPAAARATMLALAVVLVLLVVTRLAGLGERAFHHDESLHAYHSWLLARDGPAVYAYDPIYHGPFLYHTGALVFRLLPDSDVTARLPFALAGIGVVLLILPWRRWVGWGGVLALAALLALSPVLNYYARFARNDIYMALWMVGQITAVGLYLTRPRERYLFALALFVALAYCTKENSYIHHALLGGFLAVWLGWRALAGPRRLARAVLIKYLPLARLLVLVFAFLGCTFLYVAMDSRIGPGGDPLEGLRELAGHVIALSPDRAAPDPAAFGFFTAPGREEARAGFMIACAAGVGLLLAGLETASFGRARRRRGRALAAFAAGAALLYMMLAHALLTLGPALLAEPREHFAGDLREQVVGRALLLALGALLLAPAEWLDEPLGWARRWRRRAKGWLALVAQVSLILLVGGLLFSSLGTNPGGLSAGIYHYLHYWFRQQTGEYRIWGVWWYYLPRLVLYELPALVLIGLLGPAVLASRWRRPIPPRQGDWRGVPGPLLGLAGWLALTTPVVYALLNEKVGWLLTPQALALNLLAGLLLADWMARRPAPVQHPMTPLPALLGLACGFAALQHAWAVFIVPDAPYEPIVYTGTTREYAGEMNRVTEIAEARARLGLPPPRISIEGESVWPATWYLRRLEVQWGQIDPAADVIIADDSESNRAIMAALESRGRELQPVPLRGWWFWHGNTAGLPGGVSLMDNLGAFLINQSNLAGLSGEVERHEGFGTQVLAFTLGRRIWHPTAAQNVLVLHRETGGERRVEIESIGRVGRMEATIEIERPRGMIVTPAGELAVVTGAGRVDLFSPQGVHRMSMGGGLLATALGGPGGVACDGDGCLYVADTWGHAIRKFAPGGELLASRFAGLDAAGRVGLFGPRGVAVGPDGRVYITDTGNHAVRAYDADLRPLGSWGGRGEEPGRFIEPVGITVDAGGHVYVADAGNGRIQRFGPDGRFDGQVFWQAAPPEPSEEVVALEPALAMLPDGRLALSLSLARQIRIIDWASGRQQLIVLEDSDFHEPQGLAADGAGGLWVGDRAGGRVARFRLER